MAELKDDNEEDDGLSTVADYVQIYMIKVDIIGAYDLQKADTFGKSDPFVRVSAFSTKYQTAVIKDNQNPKWNDQCDLTFFNDPKRIRFEVLDYDEGIGGKDDPIGDTFLNLDDTIYDPDSSGYTGKLKLMNCKSGELEVKVIARKLIPSQLEQQLDALQTKEKENAHNIEELVLTINDWNNKNNEEEEEINTINTNITNLTADIPNHEQELSENEEKGNKLNEEMDAIKEEINEHEQKVKELESEDMTISKELEDVRIAEDKKKTENEHLMKDIEDLKQRIEQKKAEQRMKEEQQRKEREAKEKEELNQKLMMEQQEKQKQEKQKQKAQEIEEEVTPKKATPAGSKSDGTEPMLSSEQRKERQKSGGVDCCIIL